MRIFDGHNDTLLALLDPARGHGRSFFERSSTGELDLPRAREGGLAGGFFAIFVPGIEPMDFAAPRRPDMPPQPPISRARALERSLAMLGIALGLEATDPPGLRVVRSASALDDAWMGASGTEDPLVAVLHLEGAEALDPALEGLPALHALGVRSIGITSSRPNAFGHGVPFAYPSSPDTGPGLTERGRELVRACDRLGVVVDLAHLNERGFWDAAALASQPLVVSHAAAHALCRSARNLTDLQLDSVGASGGVVGITFHTEDLNGTKRASRADVVRHVEYVADRIGVDHVALGSDFDGARMPDDLADASALPALLADLAAAGWSADDVARVGHGNWLRVLRATLGEA